MENEVGSGMDKTWIKIISITGSVGVVGLIFVTLMKKFFNAEIINLLGSGEFFYILVLLICGLIIIMLFAIMKSKAVQQDASSSKSSASNKDVDINYTGGSTHNGDNNF